jgi:heterodisulfide reductase subunit A
MSITVLLCDCGKTLRDRIDYDEIFSFIEDQGIKGIIQSSAACTSLERDALVEGFREGEKILAFACTRSVCQAPLEKAMNEAGLDSDNLVIVNAKEQIAWIHDEKKKATKKAKMLLKAAIAKARSIEPMETEIYQRLQEALVVGGGIAGLTAASELADQGINVHLVERSPTIGGRMALISKTFPEEDCTRCLRGPQMMKLLNKPSINYHVGTEIKEVEKTEKGFKVKIEKKIESIDISSQNGKGQAVEAIHSGSDITYVFPEFDRSKIDEKTLERFTSNKCGECTSLFPAGLMGFEEPIGEQVLEVGSVVLATGSRDYDPSHIPKYGFTLDNVISQFQLARLIDPFGPTGGFLVRPSDAKEPKKIVMFQCVGSRDLEYNTYCSKVCCLTAIKHATIIKNHKNPDTEITVLYRDIRASGHGFESLFNEAKRLGINFVHGEIEGISAKNEGLHVSYMNGSGNLQDLDADLLVLSTGMIPSEGADKLADLFNLETSESGFFKEVDEKVANITTKVPGLYIAGACSSPKNIPDSIAQGGAAAFMSSSYIKTHVNKKINHPTLNEDTCGKCGVCRSVCPYNAITIPEDEYPQFIPELCQSCGLCVSSCPTHSLETPNFGFDLIDAQVDAILSEREDNQLIIGFCCDDCGYNLLDTVGFEKTMYSANFVPIYVNCMSNLSLRHVLNSIRKGADGIILVGCVKDRCHFLRGTQRSKGQMHIINDFFKFTGINTPIRILESSGTMVGQFIGAVSDIIKSLGGGT